LASGKKTQRPQTHYIRRFTFLKKSQRADGVIGGLIDDLPLTGDMKTEAGESTAVEYELPQYPIQMTQERQKQERRVSV